MLVLPQQTFFFSDCTVNIDPDAETLAEIGPRRRSSSAGWGSSPAWPCSPSRTSARCATRRRRRCSGPCAAPGARAHPAGGRGDAGRYGGGGADPDQDLPLSPSCADQPTSHFSNLDARTSATNCSSRVGGRGRDRSDSGGMAQPVHVLQRGSDVNDIVNMAVIAAVDAQEHGRRPRA